MPTKKPTKKPPAKARGKRKEGPARAVTATDRRAAVSGGALDTSDPLEAWKKRLAMEAPRTFDHEAIWRAVSSEVAHARGYSVPVPGSEPRAWMTVQPVALPPAALKDQADSIRTALRSVVEWLDNVNPELEGIVSSRLWLARREHLLEVRERIRPELERIHAALGFALDELKPGKQGPKPGYGRVRASLARALQNESTPRLSAKAAQSLAEDLLELAKVPKTRKRRGA
jgi:hypothetical protein